MHKNSCTSTSQLCCPSHSIQLPQHPSIPVASLPITLALQPGSNTTRSPPAPSSKHQTRLLHWTNWSLIPMREPGLLGIMGLHTTPCPCLTHLGHEKGAAGLRVFSRPSADGWLDAQSHSLVVWHTWQVCESLRGNLILPAINSSFGLILGSKHVYLWVKLNNCNWQMKPFHRIFIKTQHLQQFWLFISKWSKPFQTVLNRTLWIYVTFE